MARTADQIKRDIEEFLSREITSKPEEERTKRDELLLETGRAFADLLGRHKSMQPRIETAPFEEGVTKLLRGYNEINREYDLRDTDAEALQHFRVGSRR